MFFAWGEKRKKGASVWGWHPCGRGTSWGYSLVVYWGVLFSEIPWECTFEVMEGYCFVRVYHLMAF